MDETVIKGVEGVRFNRGDAENRKRFRISRGVERVGFNRSDAENRKSFRISRMSVEGYDTCSSREDVEEALRKHLASSEIRLIHASAPEVDDSRTTLCRYALIYVNEEDEEKALKFDGSDMGGRILQVAAYPFDSNRLDHFFAPTKAQDNYRQRTLFVTGFDPSLAKDDLEEMVRRLFPRSGCLPLGEGGVLVYLRGQDAIDKALQLSGDSVEGFVIKVLDIYPLKKLGGVCGGISRATIAFMVERAKARAEKDKANLSEGNQKTTMATD